MKYTITPLNVLMVIYAIRAVYKYFKMTHDDGLALTGLVMVFGIVLVGLLIDFGIQRFAGNYKWVLGIESVIVIALLLWAIPSGRF